MKKSYPQFLKKSLFAPFRYVFNNYHRLLFAVSEKHDYQGISLISIRDDKVFFKKARTALDLIEAYDPETFDWIKLYMPNIAHVEQGYNFYNHKARAFYIEDYYENDVGYFASYIVHEASHAYLFSDKKLDYSDKNQETHERFATERQYGFLKSMINANADLSDAEKQSNLDTYKRWFDDQLKSRWWENEGEFRHAQFEKIKSLLLNKKAIEAD